MGLFGKLFGSQSASPAHQATRAQNTSGVGTVVFVFEGMPYRRGDRVRIRSKTGGIDAQDTGAPFDVQVGPNQIGTVLSCSDAEEGVLLIKWDAQKWKEWNGKRVTKLPSLEHPVKANYLVHLSRSTAGVTVADQARAEALWKQGLTAASVGDNGKVGNVAANALKGALVVNPDFVEGHVVFAKMYLHDEGNLTRAAWHAEQAVRADPDDPKARNAAVASYFVLGKTAWKAGEEWWADAFDLCAQAVLFDPTDDIVSNAIELMNAICVKVDRRDEFVSICQLVLERNPASSVTRYSLGYTLTLADRFDEALPHLLHYVGEEPEDAEVHSLLGMAYAKHGDMENAQQELTALQGLDEEAASELEEFIRERM